MIKSFFKTIRNKRAENFYKGFKSSCYKYDDHYTQLVIYTKEAYPILLRHIHYSDNGNFNKRGIYEMFDKKKCIGYLKYIFCPETDEKVCFMFLSDIKFYQHYRNQGLGSAVIKEFEKRAYEYGCIYITGELSDVDATTEKDKNLRDSFYIKHGYEIYEGKIKKYLVTDSCYNK